MLAVRTVADIDLDQCQGCGGFWFDDGEVRKLVARLAQHPDVPELDLKAMLRKAEAAPDGGEKHCPTKAIPALTLPDDALLLRRTAVPSCLYRTP